MTTISKATSKGQITIPKKWRDKFDTNQFIIKEEDDKLVIEPLVFNKLEDNNWEEVVDFSKIKKGGIDIDDVLSRL